MSTYYYMICHQCRERCDLGSRLAGGGICQLGHSAHLAEFCIDHQLHVLQVTNEHALCEAPGESQVFDYKEPYKVITFHSETPEWCSTHHTQKVCVEKQTHQYCVACRAEAKNNSERGQKSIS